MFDTVVGILSFLSNWQYSFRLCLYQTHSTRQAHRFFLVRVWISFVGVHRINWHLIIISFTTFLSLRHPPLREKLTRVAAEKSLTINRRQANSPAQFQNPVVVDPRHLLWDQSVLYRVVLNESAEPRNYGTPCRRNVLIYLNGNFKPFSQTDFVMLSRHYETQLKRLNAV